MVFDLGSDRLDVSIIYNEEGLVDTVGTGYSNFGGREFDNILVNYCVEEFKSDFGIDIRENKEAMQKLRKACERAKCELSAQITAEIRIPQLSSGLDFMKRITREEFEQSAGALSDICMKAVEQAMNDG